MPQHNKNDDSQSSYTDCFYEAHSIAMNYFKEDVRRHGGRGAVGVTVDFEFEDAESEIEMGKDLKISYLHLIVHFVVMGTVIGPRQVADSAGNRSELRTLRVLDLRQSTERSIDIEKPKTNKQ